MDLALKILRIFHRGRFYDDCLQPEENNKYHWHKGLPGIPGGYLFGFKPVISLIPAIYIISAAVFAKSLDGPIFSVTFTQQTYKVQN